MSLSIIIWSISLSIIILLSIIISESNDETPRIVYRPLLQSDDGVLSDEFMGEILYIIQLKPF